MKVQGGSAKSTTPSSGSAVGAEAAGTVNKAGKANGATGKKSVDSPIDRGDSAKVDMSPRAQEFRKIKDVAIAGPDVNEEKVARLQKMIDAGNYKVDSEAVADRLVDEHLKMDY